MENDTNRTGRFVSSLKRVAFWALILLGLFSAGMAFRYFYFMFKYPEKECITAVPSNSIMVIESDGFSGFVNNLSGSSLWQQGFYATETMDHLSTISQDIIEIISSGDDFIKSMFVHQPFCIALVPKKDAGPEFLFILQLKKGIRPGMVHSALKLNWPSYSERRLLEISYFEKTLPDGSPLYITINDGLLIASTDREVFELGYYTIESGNNIERDPDFAEVREQLLKSQNPSAKVFLSYQGFFRWMSRFIQDEHRPLISALTEIGRWAATEIIWQEDGMHLQGFTYSSSTNTHTKSVIPQDAGIMNDPGEVLPANIAMYDQMAVNSFSCYYDQFVKGFLRELDSKKEDYPIDPDFRDGFKDALNSLNIKSVIVATPGIPDSSAQINYMICLETKYHEDMGAVIEPFSDTNQASIYQNYKISFINNSYIIPSIFGSKFQMFEVVYFTIIDDYMIIVPEKSMLLSLINAYTLNRTLAAGQAYRDLLPSFPGKMSRRYYIDKNNSSNILKSIVNKVGFESFNKLLPFLPSTVMLGYAIENDIMLTDIVITADKLADQAPYTGKILLDGTIVRKPLFITDHRINENKILVTDSEGFIYLINRRGEIEWKFLPDEEPQSDIHVIDIYKNGRQQCIFMGENMLHVIRIDGKYVAGYPVMLDQPFSEHLSIFDYENNGNYRLIYRNKQDYLSNVDIKGRRVPGWTNPKVKRFIRPIEYKRLENADFLIAVDSDYKVHFFDRRGQARISVPDEMNIAKRSDVVKAKSLETWHFSFLHDDGLLVYLSSTGDMTLNFALQFSSNAWFFSADCNDNGDHDIVVAEKQRVSVYDNGFKLLNRIEPVNIEIKTINKCSSEPNVLFTLISDNNIPYAVKKDNLKLIRLSDKSFDHADIWKCKRDNKTYVILCKGSLIKIERF